MSWLFLFASLVGAWFTYNAYRPRFRGDKRAVISFFAGWLTAELALHHIAWQAFGTLFFVWAGALQAWPGKLGLVITIVSWVALHRCYWRAHETEAVVEAALRAGLKPDYREQILPDMAERFSSTIDWKVLAMPFPMRHAEVECTRDIVYSRAGGLNLKLDVYRHKSAPKNCPTLLQIHGGGWVIGSKNEQAIPLMLQMASRGWVCVSADYRLSPHATFPEHLIDCKRALQWVRETGPEYGVDPNFVVVTGGSAGGHLSSLMALTANVPEYQPGFEHVDTTLQGCVAFYGVYDFTDRHGVYPNRGLGSLLEQRVLKTSFADAPDRWHKASPMSCVSEAAPPFFIIHGDLDTLVPVQDARNFAEALRNLSCNPVVYAEIPGAQHAFEIFPSLRTTFVIHGVERFLAYVYSQYLQTASARHQAEAVHAVA